jgi:hypothetical protein
MVKDNKNLLMVISILVSIFMGNLMDLGNIVGLMEVFMKVDLKKV